MELPFAVSTEPSPLSSASSVPPKTIPLSENAASSPPPSPPPYFTPSSSQQGIILSPNQQQHQRTTGSPSFAPGVRKKTNESSSSSRVYPVINNDERVAMSSGEGGIGIGGARRIETQVLSHFGAAGGTEVQSASPAPKAVQSGANGDDFCSYDYVNVDETDADEVDIMIGGIATTAAGVPVVDDTAIDENDEAAQSQKPATAGDVLAILLSENRLPQERQQQPAQQSEQIGGGEAVDAVANAPPSAAATMVAVSEEASAAAAKASTFKRQGDVQAAAASHSAAAHLFHQAALQARARNASVMADSFLLLCQTQAKSALALQGVLRVRPNSLFQVNKISDKGEAPSNNSSRSIGNSSSNGNTQKERLRATVRGALDCHAEADLSESAFLGKVGTAPADNSKLATKAAQGFAKSFFRATSTSSNKNQNDPKDSNQAEQEKKEGNPIDEMMELERELRDMDMALEIGNSIASLDNHSARSNNQRVRNNATSIVEGSFMVVPSNNNNNNANSYMSSSIMWTPAGQQQHSQRNNNHTNPKNHSGSSTVKARNRVQNILEASNSRPQQQQSPQQQIVTSVPTSKTTTHSLDSSWWGNSSVATSQGLTSSVISLASGVGGDHGASRPATASSSNINELANTKQLMRLMDSLKTLGDENASLLRQVEDAEAARTEAKVAREEMERFRKDYERKFATMKEAIIKSHREQQHKHGGQQQLNVVSNSEFIKATSTSEQLQRQKQLKKQEQLIRRLTADLKKEKEESKKKDVALRKYESFYREVKARSAQKAAQRQQKQQQTQQQRQQSRNHVPRGPR